MFEKMKKYREETTYILLACLFGGLGIFCVVQTIALIKAEEFLPAVGCILATGICVYIAIGLAFEVRKTLWRRSNK